MNFNQRWVKGENRISTTATAKSREVLGLGEKGNGMRERDGPNPLLQLIFGLNMSLVLALSSDFGIGPYTL
ncbi:transmembrane protein, putative [Medicago truncatula]|uniref:Transmembrane protein, putative n=1 Tax=Medicago truncatula TaxID=3880 RepID=G7KSW9_MEDTR|nr:transmembrane protein, putative [Medicago truncatula]